MTWHTIDFVCFPNGAYSLLIYLHSNDGRGGEGRGGGGLHKYSRGLLPSISSHYYSQNLLVRNVFRFGCAYALNFLPAQPSGSFN